MQIFETIKECNEYISLAALKEAYIVILESAERAEKIRYPKK